MGLGANSSNNEYKNNIITVAVLVVITILIMVIGAAKPQNDDQIMLLTAELVWEDSRRVAVNQKLRVEFLHQKPSHPHLNQLKRDLQT